MHDNINVAVGGPINADYPKVYKTKFLKPGIPVSLQVTEPNTKYVIKYNFDLYGETVTIPEGCLLEFDGGSISNGTIEFDNTILIYNQQEEDVLKNITMVGGYEVSAGGKGDKKDNINGMGKIYLKKNKGFAEQLIQDNTIYVIQYDFDLGEENVTIPENCVLEFDGGSLSNGTIEGQNTNINGFGKGFINITFNNHHEIPASLLGIMPNTDCSENFIFYTKQHLTIKFEPNDYYLTLKNHILGKHCSLIGADHSKNTRLHITPTDNPYYLIGVNYYCSIKDIKILIEGTEQKGIDVLRIDNSFGENDSSAGSWYQYFISNIEIQGVWIADYDFVDGDTAIAIKTNEVDDGGSFPQASALSYKNTLNNVCLRFFKCGIRLENKRESGSETPIDKYWQNSLLFSDLVITALIGIHFDRENIGNSSGYCMISNYIFQSVNNETSFGIYGWCKNDMISNYVSWDNKYLGCVWGNLYANDTARLSNGVSQSVNYSLTTNGFLVPNGKTLILNAIPNGISYFMPDNYTNQLRLHKVDYTSPLTKEWTPATSESKASILSGIKSLQGSSIVFTKQYKYGMPVIEDTIVDNDYLPEKKTVAYQRSTGRYYTLERFKYPTIEKIGQSVYQQPYNFKTYIQYIDTSLYAQKSGVLVVEINLYGSGSGATISDIIINSIETNVGKVVDIKTQSLLKRKVYINIDNVSSLYLSLTYKVTSFTNNDQYEPDVSNNLPNVSILDFLQNVGTVSNKPSGTNIYVGFRYIATDINGGTPIYYIGDANKLWTESDGAAAGVKRSGTFAQKPTASDIYVGFHYFCTDKKTTEGAINGIEIIHKGNNVWVDALGRVVS